MRSGAIAEVEGTSPPSRPPNRARAAFHIGSALFCLLLTLVVFTPEELPWAAVAFAGTAWFLETLRRVWPKSNDWMMWFFRPIAHPSEASRVNSATWYMTALVPLAMTGSTILCVIGVAVLGFGDPAAAFVGRRWGRIKVSGQRTLEGGIAFVLAGAAAALGFVQLIDGPPAPSIAVFTALAAALVGGTTELFSRRVDDNFSIPLASAAAAAIALMLLGISPW